MLLIGELLKQAEVYISDVCKFRFHNGKLMSSFMVQGVHPHLITEGFQLAYDALVKLLHECKQSPPADRNLLFEVARTAVRTKLDQGLADHVGECVVDAVLAIRRDEQDNEPDLHMIEIMVCLNCFLT